MNIYIITLGFPDGASGKEPAGQRRICKRHRFNPWVGKISWRRASQPTPVFLPGESHWQKSLVGYSSWGRKELNTTEWLTHTHKDSEPSKLALVVKNLPANAEDIWDWVQSLGWEDPLEEGGATQSSMLFWRIPLTEEPGGLQFTRSQSQTWLKRLSVQTAHKS